MVSSVAVTHRRALLSTGHTPPATYTAGYALGFWVIAGVALAGLVLALLTIRPVASGQPTPVALEQT